MMKENKKTFEKPELDVIKFSGKDVIATSGSKDHSVESTEPSLRAFQIIW